ncbi:MAG: DUF108 domain-containing protein [Candidatus Omnitrophica bacterium]|nr:DUF108 domain-containing protein [Candidatus Omnitrophota bacterium]
MPHEHGKKRIAIIGCGVIGSALAGFASRELKDKVSGIILWDISPSVAAEVVSLIPQAETAVDMADAVKRSDLAIEAAHPAAAREALELAIRMGKDVMVMSVGGLLGSGELLKRADKEGVRVLLPSGAIAGIDAIKAAAMAGIENVTLTTIKSPESLKSSTYLALKGVDLASINVDTVVFDGTVEEAVKAFPKNINVSAALAIAAGDPRLVRVKIMASPGAAANIHEIEVKGPAGRMTTRCENVPSPGNPGTSHLAVLAAERTLKDYFSGVRIGT